ncbi:MAG: sulfatase, partial [Opitutales bacterium]|nr:sulfatase [Opitutales bacterium]
MNPLLEKIQLNTRRHFLKHCGMGLGAGALAQLLTPEAFALKAPRNPLLPRDPHYSPKAKRVIYVHLTGSPPHLDLWDYKPELVKRTDQDCPDEFVKGKMFAFTSGTPKLMGTPRTFGQYGKSGMWMSDA